MAPKAGFDLDLTRAIADAVSVPVIASGGVGTLDHLVEGSHARRTRAPCSPPRSSISARTRSDEAKQHMAEAGIAVRAPG